jgi:hypothetical protein
MKKITVLLTDKEEEDLQKWAALSNYPVDQMTGIFIRKAMIWESFFHGGFIQIPPDPAEIERRLKTFQEEGFTEAERELIKKNRLHPRHGFMSDIKKLLGGNWRAGRANK